MFPVVSYECWVYDRHKISTNETIKVRFFVYNSKDLVPA